MQKTCRFLFFILFFLSLASSLWAQSSGLYLGGYVGGQLLAPAKGEDSLGTFNLEYRPAPSASVVVGWELEPGNILGEGRVELEFTQRSNRLDQIEFSDGKVTGEGDYASTSVLLNTFSVYRNARHFRPYLGVGIGVARITAKGLSLGAQPLSDDATMVLAYQFGTGVDVVLTRTLTLDLGYRLFNTTKAKLQEASGDKFETTYLSHSAMIGLRRSF